MTPPEKVQDFRAEYRRSRIGRWYRGWAHFTFTSVTSLAVIAFAASRVHGARPAEWLVLPCGFLFANAGEYFGHKGPMHRPARLLSILFERHTREHHHYFTHEAMNYESSRDFKMVLFPPVMLLFFLGLLATPVALALFVLVSANAGWLWIATGMAYFLTYEWLHFAYHLRPDTWVGRLPFMQALRRHHTVHHDLSLMGKYNFNITFPICDRVFGTHYGRATARTDELELERKRCA